MGCDKDALYMGIQGFIHDFPRLDNYIHAKSMIADKFSWRAMYIQSGILKTSMCQKNEKNYCCFLRPFFFTFWLQSWFVGKLIFEEIWESCF